MRHNSAPATLQRINSVHLEQVIGKQELQKYDVAMLRVFAGRKNVTPLDDASKEEIINLLLSNSSKLTSLKKDRSYRRATVEKNILTTHRLLGSKKKAYIIEKTEDRAFNPHRQFLAEEGRRSVRPAGIERVPTEEIVQSSSDRIGHRSNSHASRLARNEAALLSNSPPAARHSTTQYVRQGQHLQEFVGETETAVEYMDIEGHDVHEQRNPSRRSPSHASESSSSLAVDPRRDFEDFFPDYKIEVDEAITFEPFMQYTADPKPHLMTDRSLAWVETMYEAMLEEQEMTVRAVAAVKAHASKALSEVMLAVQGMKKEAILLKAYKKRVRRMAGPAFASYLEKLIQNGEGEPSEESEVDYAALEYVGSPVDSKGWVDPDGVEWEDEYGYISTDSAESPKDLEPQPIPFELNPRKRARDEDASDSGAEGDDEHQPKKIRLASVLDSPERIPSGSNAAGHADITRSPSFTRDPSTPPAPSPPSELVHIPTVIRSRVKRGFITDESFDSNIGRGPSRLNSNFRENGDMYTPAQGFGSLLFDPTGGGPSGDIEDPGPRARRTSHGMKDTPLPTHGRKPAALTRQPSRRNVLQDVPARRRLQRTESIIGISENPIVEHSRGEIYEEQEELFDYPDEVMYESDAIS